MRNIYIVDIVVIVVLLEAVENVENRKNQYTKLKKCDRTRGTTYGKFMLGLLGIQHSALKTQILSIFPQVIN